MGQSVSTDDEIKAAEKAEAAERRATYLAALKHELGDYEAAGKAERAADVKAEIARVEGKAGRQKAVTAPVTT